MKRRGFITLIGGAAAMSSVAAQGQQVERVRRVGVMPPGTENDSDTQARLAAFRLALERLGWKEGHNIRLEYRWTSGIDVFIPKLPSQQKCRIPLGDNGQQVRRRPALYSNNPTSFFVGSF